MNRPVVLLRLPADVGPHRLSQGPVTVGRLQCFGWSIHEARQVDDCTEAAPRTFDDDTAGQAAAVEHANVDHGLRMGVVFSNAPWGRLVTGHAPDEFPLGRGDRGTITNPDRIVDAAAPWAPADDDDPDGPRAEAKLATAGPQDGREVCLIFDHRSRVVEIWVTVFDVHGAATKTGRLSWDPEEEGGSDFLAAVQDGLEAVFE